MGRPPHMSLLGVLFCDRTGCGGQNPRRFSAAFEIQSFADMGFYAVCFFVIPLVVETNLYFSNLINVMCHEPMALSSSIKKRIWANAI